MIDRRGLLQMVGLGAVATALSMIPVADAKPTPTMVLAPEFQEPLSIVAFTRGLEGERYEHPMPAKAHYAPGCDNLVIDCIACFTGTVISLDLRRDNKLLLTMLGSELDTPHVVHGMTIRLTHPSCA